MPEFKLRTVVATRYVTPLREGGSLPALIEADDGALYVLKFRGAGQGARALIAEILVGEMARFLGLPMPEIVFVELDAVLARTEPDPEIQELIKASEGLNLALKYLPGSISYDPLHTAPALVQPGLTSMLVWLDAFTTNVDRTPRNPNLLVWERKLWLIDHGAALYFHHSWDDYLARSKGRFPQIKEHVLLPLADALEETDYVLAPQLTAEVFEAIAALIPDAWLGDVPQFASVEEHRRAYVSFLQSRLEAPRDWFEEAMNARARL